MYRLSILIAALIVCGSGNRVRGEVLWDISNPTQFSQQLPLPLPSVQPPQSQILIAEVVVRGTDDPQLREAVYRAMILQPGQTITRPQLQQATNAILATGWFQDVRPLLENTPLGIRLTWQIQPNPPLRSVVIEGSQILPPGIIEQSFVSQYGQRINLNHLSIGIEQITTWYQEKGYVLAQIQAPKIQADGTVILPVTEGVIEEIQVRFLNADRKTTDADGNPIEGNTREFIIRREIELEPGDIFNQTQIQQDLIWISGLGLFQDVWLDLEPSETDPNQVVMVVNVIEQSTGSIIVGGGLSSETGLFGTVSYQELNLGGNNQKLIAEFQLGERLFLLDVSFTDPWIAGDPYRTSYTVNGFRGQGVSVVFEDGDEEVRLPNGDRPRLIRTGGNIRFTRPLIDHPHETPEWIASAGIGYQRVQIVDSDGEITPRDDEGQLLSGSESGEDDLFTVQLGIVRDRRNNRVVPTSGSLFQFATQQAIPFGSGRLSFNRLRGSYIHYFPVNWLNFSEGPQTIAMNLQGGTILGDFPPYEGFAIGGTDSVRGWEAGALGVGKSFILGSVEYRFPVFSTNNFAVGGTLFLDAASTLGTQSSVPGNPGERRGKPGQGLGYGAGLRIQSPIGPIRIDYGISNEGKSRIHFGIGERF